MSFHKRSSVCKLAARSSTPVWTVLD
uniref:Uncharacterized protein n=1 Tax=Moniliophthora roreri TaxID=221103 RepID=A0A0W0FU70_MONRR